MHVCVYVARCHQIVIKLMMTLFNWVKTKIQDFYSRFYLRHISGVQFSTFICIFVLTLQENRTSCRNFSIVNCQLFSINNPTHCEISLVQNATPHNFMLNNQIKWGCDVSLSTGNFYFQYNNYSAWTCLIQLVNNKK